jgi:circadian clock protein KaiC
MTDGIVKSPTGIDGFDDLTLGGLPTGRPTLVCGSAGCGKTLFASTFLFNGARMYDQPGIFVTFEERPVDIVANVESLGFDLKGLIDRSKIHIEHIAIDPSELAEIGDYDLEGLFLRLELAVDQIGAKRIVLDTIESLFSAFANPAILRAEIRRLFDWLKHKGLTAVITGERGDGSLTRHGLEEYVSDCVILLDHRVENQISTRRLRIVKYRGTAHGTNEYPFLIDEEGFSVLPVSSLGLGYRVFDERISTGVPDLDAMLAGGGFYRGSSILLTGVAGSGKSPGGDPHAALQRVLGEPADQGRALRRARALRDAVERPAQHGGTGHSGRLQDCGLAGARLSRADDQRREVRRAVDPRRQAVAPPNRPRRGRRPPDRMRSTTARW